MNYNINEQGRSMIEMLGVLAIVGVLSVGGIAGYSKAMNKFKVNKTIDQINMIATNIRTLYASQKNYYGLNNIVAKKAGAIPAEMYTNSSNNKIINPFGGNWYIEGLNSDFFYIVIDAVPSTACVSILTAEWGADSSAGLVALGINNYGMFGFIPNNPAASLNDSIQGQYIKGSDNLPFSITDASTACNYKDNKYNTLISIAWMYR
jgi:type II secretory pathway pseudopilin PulG